MVMEGAGVQEYYECVLYAWLEALLTLQQAYRRTDQLQDCRNSTIH
jgi:hypothetical protein